MSAGDKESLLSRWSRRKLDAAKETAAPKPPLAPAPAAAAKAELPPVDTLKGLLSEYQEFLRPGVDEKLRQAALKKLFRDPHFNVMDGLDVYIDDYSKPDPIPDAMLAALAHAKRLLLDEEKEPAQGTAETPPALPEAPPASAAPAAASTGKKDEI
jgi:hypothetical protein